MKEQHTQPVPNHGADEGTGTSKRFGFRKSWAIALVSASVGIALGSAATGSSDVTTTEQYVALAAERDDLAATTSAVREELADVETELESLAGDLPEREDALAQAQADLDKREAALLKAEEAVAQAEKAVTKREKEVGIAEDVIARNTISGDGMYQVGADIRAGTYKTPGAPGCYYAVLNSTDTFDIAENNNTDGQAFVTVRDGQYLQVTRCADWVLQR